MTETFTEMLAAGGKANSLGRVNEVIEVVLQDRSRLAELYACLFDENAWIRMRAADALEKICRQYPDWIQPYVDEFFEELATSTQPSIQWHLAQMYREVDLTAKQKHTVIAWLKHLLSTTDVDWIVSANAMDTLVKFTKDGSVLEAEAVSLIKLQQKHKSKSVVRRADKLLAILLAE
ncbi:MAG TPA: hypothetical protein VLA92_02560 [Candidatus Saccharimonadales bacterium]|nr:hypothetical protein [Candidatus Saccharimonadales bacterium]